MLRYFRFMMLFMFVASAFAPVLNQPVIAESEEPDLPEVELVVTEDESETPEDVDGDDPGAPEGEDAESEGHSDDDAEPDDSGQGDRGDSDEENPEDTSDTDPVQEDEAEVDDAEPVESVEADAEPTQLIPVVPVAPVVAECGDASAIQLATSAAEVEYSLVDYGEGSYIVEARLLNADTHTWGETTDPWLLDGDVAFMLLNLEPCPVEEDATEGDPHPESEAEEEESDQPEMDETREPEELGLSSSMAPMSTSADISVSFDPWPAGTVWPGREVIYYVDVTNNELDPVTLEFTSQLSEHVHYGWFLSSDPGFDCAFSPELHTLRCFSITGGHLTPGATATILIMVTVAAPVPPQNCPTTISMSVFGTGENVITGAKWTENNSASYTHQVTCIPPSIPGLSVVIDPLTPGPVYPGDTLTYLLTVFYGPSSLVAFQTYVTLPEEVEYLNAQPNHGGGLVSCSDPAVDHIVRCGTTGFSTVQAGFVEYIITVGMKNLDELAECPDNLIVPVEGERLNSEDVNIWAENNTDSASNPLICDPNLLLSRTVEPIVAGED